MKKSMGKIIRILQSSEETQGKKCRESFLTRQTRDAKDMAKAPR